MPGFGVMGWPDKASPELARAIVDGIVSAAAERIRRLEAQADGVYRDVFFTPEPVAIRSEAD